MTMSNALPAWNGATDTRHAVGVALAPLVRVQAPRSAPARAKGPATTAWAKAGCAACAMRRGCVSSELNDADLPKFEEHAWSKRRIKAGQHLYRSGEESGSLYIVRSGFIMTTMATDDGREQVTGFQMLGEVIGVDMIGGGAHTSDAVALEDTEVCELSLKSLESLSKEMPALQRKLYRMIGEQFHRERQAMLLLGSLRADERLATFLVNLGHRYRARGFSASRFVLRMSRGDIGSYLGLRLETVSRNFSKFQAEGLLRVDGRYVEILDPEALKLVIGRSVN
jgi:CRP/FNR family transcriptional regulator